MTIEGAIYRNQKFRKYIRSLLSPKHLDLEDDLIQEALVVAAKKYDVEQLAQDGALPFVIGAIAKRLVMSDRGRFRRVFFRKVVPTPYADPSLLMEIDEFRNEAKLTDFQKILLDALETDSIKAISVQSGVSYKTLLRHSKILKMEWQMWRKKSFE